MDKIPFMAFDPAQHSIEHRRLSDEVLLIGATALVHSLIPDLSTFDFQKQKFLLHADGRIIIVYRQDKVITPLVFFRHPSGGFVLCTKYETDWIKALAEETQKPKE